MSTRILILKDGVITPTKSSTDINSVINSLGVLDLNSNQTIGGIKTFSGGLTLPITLGTSIGTIWRNIDNLEYKDSANITKILLNSAGNLNNLSNKQTSLNNLIGTQTANRLLRSDGTNVTLSQVGLTTDVIGVLPITNGGTNSSTQTWVDLTTDQTIAGIKTFSNTTQSTSTTTGGAIFGGGVGIAGNQNTGGFTSLGSANTGLKMQVFSFTSPVGTNLTSVASGLPAMEKIVGITGLIFASTTDYFPPNHYGGSFYGNSKLWSVYSFSGIAYMILHPDAVATMGSRPGKIIVTYIA